jgi:hypothetical protein
VCTNRYQKERGRAGDEVTVKCTGLFVRHAAVALSHTSSREKSDATALIPRGGDAESMLGSANSYFLRL